MLLGMRPADDGLAAAVCAMMPCNDLSGWSSSVRVLRVSVRSASTILNTARPAFQVAGWVGIWVALVAFYAATAIMTGEVWNHVSPCTQHTFKSLGQGR